jgi:polyketide synthase 12
LGVRTSAPGTDAVYETVLTATAPAWLADHQVGGQVVVPGTVLVELVRAAAEDHQGLSSRVTGLLLQKPMLVTHGALRVQVVLTDDGARASVYSQPVESKASLIWSQHASADLSAAPDTTPGRVDLAVLQQRCTEPVDVNEAYAELGSVGLHYGPVFQGLRGLWRGPGEALAHVVLPEGVDVRGYGVHPALLDAALQATGWVSEPGEKQAYLPFELGEIRVHAAGGPRPGCTRAMCPAPIRPSESPT